MNYMSLLSCSSSDYYGFSVVLAVTGCAHHCEGCWAKGSGGWKHTSGLPFTDGAYKELLTYASQPFIHNVVIQGGDPLYGKNVSDVIALCQRLKVDLPDKKVILFTGYTFEQVQADVIRSQVLPLVDVVIDGKYKKDLPTKKPFRGSDNQRMFIKDGEWFQKD